jgi:hypothetical protein
MFRYLAGAVIGLLLPLLSSAQCLTTLTPNPVFVPPAPYPSSALRASSGMAATHCGHYWALTAVGICETTC